MRAVIITLFVIYLLQSTINAPVAAESRHKRTVVNTGSQMSNAEAQQTLDLHNYLRGLQSSSNMELMVWNNVLAQMAQDWADECKFEHPPAGAYAVGGSLNPYYNAYVGQNIHATTANPLDPVAGTQGWYDEINYYDYATGNCTDVCGHYTQVVWSSSYELGCAYTFCPGGLPDSQNQLILNGSSASILVCNYGPSGNWPGESPFAIGTPCTECHGSLWCTQDKFCSVLCDGSSGCSCDVNACQNCGTMDQSTCTCSCKAGTSGSSCATFLPVCSGPDTSSGCPYWKSLEYCEASSIYHIFMTQTCPEQCGFCIADPSAPVGCAA